MAGDGLLALLASVCDPSAGSPGTRLPVLARILLPKGERQQLAEADVDRRPETEIKSKDTQFSIPRVITSLKLLQPCYRNVDRKDAFFICQQLDGLGLQTGRIYRMEYISIWLLALKLGSTKVTVTLRG